MTRRDWVLAIGAGLCVSLVPGCSHSLGQTTATGPPSPLPGEAAAKLNPGPLLPPVPSAPAARPAEAPPEQVPSTSRADLPPDPPPVRDPGSVPKEPKELVAIEPAREPAPEARAEPVPDAPLVAALRCILNKQPDEALAWLKRYDPRAQELLLCLLPLAARLSEARWQQTPEQEVAVILGQLDQLADALRPLAPLTIGKMCFCSDIKTYGVYTPLPDEYGFQPGELVHVYVEVQNFTIEREKDNRYGIHLASRVEIRDEYDKPVWSPPLDDAKDPDLSRTPRRDFFNYYKFSLSPDWIQPGRRYILRLEVTDLPTHRTVLRTLDFRVVPARVPREE